MSGEFDAVTLTRSEALLREALSRLGNPSTGGPPHYRSSEIEAFL